MPIILRAPKIVHLIIMFGAVSCFGTIINLNEFEVVDFVLTISSLFYWILAFLFGFTIVKLQSHSIMLTINGFSISFLVILYYYSTIVLFFNFFGAPVMTSLNQSYYVLLLLPFLLMLKKNYLKLIGIIIVSIALTLSNKRGGTIAALAAIGVYFIILTFKKEEKKNERIRTITLIIFSSILLYFVFNYLSSRTEMSLINRFSNLQTDQGSGRLEIWKETYELQMESDIYGWFFGHGYNSVAESKVNVSAHNDFQEVLYDYGFIAFALYISLYFQIFKYLKRMNENNSRFFPPFAASFVLFIIMSSISHLIIYPSYFIYLAFFWGIIIAGFENDQKSLIRLEDPRLNFCSSYKL